MFPGFRILNMFHGKSKNRETLEIDKKISKSENTNC